MAVDFTPKPGSFLWAVQQAHPNQPVTCANFTGRAASVATEVRQMLNEIADLREENARLGRIVSALSYTDAAPSLPQKG